MGFGPSTGKSLIATKTNNRLDEIRASALAYYRELYAAKEEVTAEEVKTLLLGMASGQQTLLAYFRSRNENFDKRIGVNRKKRFGKRLLAGFKSPYRIPENQIQAFGYTFYRTRQVFIQTTPLPRPKHYLIRDLFLFSCYTGIPYCDMCKLSEEHIEIAGDGTVWIKTCREKTGMDYEIPLLELPLQILDRYVERPEVNFYCRCIIIPI